MSDFFDATTMSVRKNAQLRNGGFQLYSGLLLKVEGGGTIASDINALTNVGHNLAVNKYYFEAAINELSTVPGDDGAGLGIDTITTAFDPVFAGPKGMVLYSNGNVYSNGILVHSVPMAPLRGMNGIVRVAAGAGQIWWAINAGLWNGIANADPAKGISGFSITPAPIHWIFGNVGCEDDGFPTTLDINTGPVFEFPVPLGFEPWAPIVPISQGSPNPPAPNAISPGGVKGIRWSYTDTKDW